MSSNPNDNPPPEGVIMIPVDWQGKAPDYDQLKEAMQEGHTNFESFLKPYDEEKLKETQKQLLANVPPAQAPHVRDENVPPNVGDENVLPARINVRSNLLNKAKKAKAAMDTVVAIFSGAAIRELESEHFFPPNVGDENVPPARINSRSNLLDKAKKAKAAMDTVVAIFSGAAISKLESDFFTE